MSNDYTIPSTTVAVASHAPPITKAAHGDTVAHGAVMDTKPASAELAMSLRLYGMRFQRRHINSAMADAAGLNVVATTCTVTAKVPTKTTHAANSHTAARARARAHTHTHTHTHTCTR